jgi:hypothetical protein
VLVMRSLLSLLFGIVLLSAGLCWGGTIYVKPDGTGDAPTIGAAMAAAAVGDTLVLASGTFTGAGNHGVTIPNKNLMIVSETGQADDCVIDCEGDFGFKFENGSAVIKGLRMTNAVLGALRVWTWVSHGYITLAVKNCVFSNCEGDGGAIDVSCSGEVRITGCNFLSNAGDTYGAVLVYPGYYLQVLIYGCTFCGNTADYGAAISCTWMEGYVLIRNSVFCHNSAEQEGGAIGLGDNSPEIVGCSFFANSAPLGSAIAGGYWPMIAGCILAYGTGGRALYGQDELWGPTISCSDIFGNEGGDWVGVIAGQLGQHGNFSACPSFCNWDIEPYDLHLCSASPCLPGNHPDGVNCGLIGALGQGCDCSPSGTEPTTWGALKAMYK